MNLQNIMAQAQRMQKEIQTKQDEIYKKEFTGKSAWVTVTMTGNRKNVRTTITYNGVIESDDDKEMLSDMISVALQDAYSQIEKEIEHKLGSYSKQLGGLL